MTDSDGAHIFPPRADDQRIIDAIAAQGGPFGLGIDGDFRKALGNFLGLSDAEILAHSVDDMWKHYLDDQGLVNAAEPFSFDLAAAGIEVGAGVAYGLTATAGDMVFDLPAHSAGDVLVLATYIARTDDLNDLALVSTPGWVELDAAERRVFSGSAMTQRVWTKVGDGVETTVTVTNGYVGGAGFSLACVAVSGVHPDIFDVTPITSHSKLQNNSANPTAVALTSTVDGSLMILFCGHSRPFGTHDGPTGYATAAANSFSSASVYAVTKEIEVAGLETPGPWNTTGVNPGADNLLMSLTLKPDDPDPDITEYIFGTTGTFSISGNNHNTPYFNLPGTRAYFNRSSSLETWQYSMSTPGDMSTISFELTHDWGTTQLQRAISFNPDRSKFYKIRRSTTGADSFVSADPFSVTEAGEVAGGNPETLTGVSTLAPIVTPVTPTAFVVPPGDLDLFVMSGDLADRSVYHYQMSIAGDAGTALPQGQVLDVSTEFDTNLFTMVYSPDGSKLFILGTNSGDVIIAQYDMALRFDVTTAVYSGKQITVTPLSTVLLGLFVWDNPAGGFQFNLTWPVGGASNGSAWAFDRYDAP